jgi:hypothetical protein
MKANPLTIAAVLITTLSAYNNSDATDAPKPVDFSFSLECRALEGPYEKPLSTTIEEWEERYAEAKQAGNFDSFRRDFKDVVYDKSVRVAYVHGKVDDGAFDVLARTFVTEVTPEIIVIAGDWTPIGPILQGSFDRRTGAGWFTVYAARNPSDTKWAGTTMRIYHQQFAFQCEPSKPAKF